MSEAPRVFTPITTLWCLAGAALAVWLRDGPPEPGPSVPSSTAGAQWPDEMQGVVLRPRHAPFP